MESPFYGVRARAKLRPGNHARVAEWQTQGTQKPGAAVRGPRFVVNRCPVVSAVSCPAARDRHRNGIGTSLRLSRSHPSMPQKQPSQHSERPELSVVGLESLSRI
jgi:hypothetical protein